ncbi:class I SAM-dependent methyltransferase [Clostridium sp. CCUG 7971]|uniref:class I SAM-dependent methyltransferase n=1 Tax=Clostridium sp. CCUG 7971 TaxID=2811414 RepID=UPI001ABBC1D1|nr:class I SAM-dependent methyltransferase [Clostridium sp. CCUG 7971]MBO3443933.1 class I SAM-dependent methyltransferase [Clostridium sp. CCUG 7971]
MIKNVYDDNLFFQEYSKIRDNVDSYNDLIEQPAMKKLLPDLDGKKVLDLGCGNGNNCVDFIRRGAKKVIGVDSSLNMLDVAMIKNSHPDIQYTKMDINEISSINEKFDLVYSSLVFHYIKDYKILISNIRKLLKPQGILLYSQEHPNTTAPKNGCIWTKDEDGNKLYSHLSDYMYSGKREVKWLSTNVEKYHRSISEIINILIDEKFSIEKIIEPVPDEYILNKRPDMIDEFHRPTSIIIKAQINI